MTAFADEQGNPGRYFVVSTGLHILMIVVANLVALMFVVQKKETIQIEVLSTPPPIQARAHVVEETPAAASAPAVAQRDDVVAPRPPPVVAKSPSRASPRTASHRAPPMKAKASARAAPQRARPTVAEPDFSDTVPDSPVVVAAPKFDSHLVDDDLNKVSKEETSKFKNKADESKEQLTADADSLEKDVDQSSDNLKKEVDAKDAQMADKVQAQALMDREELSKIKASEDADKAKRQAAAEKAAEAKRQAAEAHRRADEARAQAAADKARQDELARAGREKGAQKGSVAAVAAGSNGEDGNVRQIEDLRQMPGNKKPQYEEQERFDRLEGTVIFRAIVTKEGNLNNFKLVQSSGHRSLDLKALAAMRTWKFYPGQQGPVEMPFAWNIKGGPQERPTGLRKKISVSEARHN